jgi:hypothetical protein
VRRPARAALVAVLALGLVACDAYTIGPVPTIELRTAEPLGPGSPQACMAALLTGVLVREERSGIGIVSEDGTRWAVIWPPGFVGVTGDPAFVTNVNGQRIAKVGDHVTLGGGEVAPETWQTCGELTVIAP